MLDDLWLSTLALKRRFRQGHDPFKMVARLAEECGELAAEVQHWESEGLKRERLGKPDPTHTAKEVMDVLRAALAIADYYGLHEQLERTIRESIEYALHEGSLTRDDIDSP